MEKVNSDNKNSFIENRFAYTSRELDQETGLYYYRARWYDPEVGRFVSEDPIGFSAGDTNLYRYVGGNPISRNDPSGKNAVVKVCLAVGLGVAIGLYNMPDEPKTPMSSPEPTGGGQQNINSCPKDKPSSSQKTYCKREPDNDWCKQLDYCEML